MAWCFTGQLDVLRELFMTNQCVVLEKLLEPVLLENLQRQIEQAPWRCTTYNNVGTELTLDDPVAVHILLFLLNRAEFLNAIRFITGCEEISDFLGISLPLGGGPSKSAIVAYRHRLRAP